MSSSLPDVPNDSLPHSFTGNVKPMSIQGRFANDRERLTGNFTDADRQWRKKWLNDQILAPDEPRHVPELQKAIRNPIRRFYRFPMDYIFSKLEPKIGSTSATTLRWLVPKLFLVYLGFCAFHYQSKYNPHDWTRHSGWIIRKSRSDVLPCDPGYPMLSDRNNPQDYGDHGFKSRKVFMEV